MRDIAAAALCTTGLILGNPLPGLAQDVLTTHRLSAALAADPKHALTWSYYGMWHAEQGNLLKAKDDLEQVRLICGTECKEYVALKEVIDGTRTY